MEVDKAVFYNTDTLTANTSYRFNVEKIKLNVNSFLPIIFKKQLIIDSLSLEDPDIIVTRLKPSDQPKKDFSIPQEMGKVYNSIRQALEILKVKRFQIDNAKFTLINKIHPEQQPLTITNIFFHINNIRIDSTGEDGKEKILFGENAVLRNRNQDIIFPDGRHRLSYSRFRINLKKRLVEFDSCTIAATKTDSSASSFRVYFDSLFLTNIDFDTLYRYDVIKADSVYCVNPKFDLNVTLGKKSNKRAPAPRLDKIIEQLTGDLQLGFVIVNNASINIGTVREDRPNAFSSDHNNFEIQGLTVDENAEHPLKVKSFAMAIRNYENFFRDSSYTMEFDSILFNDDRIFLSNFKLNQLDHGKRINTFSMPQFQLKGLSWDELVFNRQLKADEATLYHPIIDYTFFENKQRKKKKGIFNKLTDIGKMLEIDELNVVQGKINLKLKDNTQLHLQNATLSLKSSSLLDSKGMSTIDNSVNELLFSKGVIQTKDLTIQLDNVHYTGKNKALLADKMQVHNKQKTIGASADNVSFTEILIDDSTGNIQATGLQWKKADINITLPESPTKKPFSSYAVLKNITGNNTNLHIVTAKRSVDAFIKTISFDRFLKRPGKEIEFENPFVEGKKLKMIEGNSLLTIDDYRIADKKNSSFENIGYSRYNAPDSVSIQIPHVSLTPDIYSIMHQATKLDNIEILNPLAKIKLSKQDSAVKGSTSLPHLDINKISIQQPDINFSRSTEKGTITLKWNGPSEKNNTLNLINVSSDNKPVSKATIGNARFTLNHFLYIAKTGKTFDAGDGEISAELNNIKLIKDESNQKWNWESLVKSTSAKNFVMDSLGKNSGRLELYDANLENLSISSSSINSLKKITDQNSSLQLKKFTGQYNNTNNHFAWFNAGFDENSKTFSADSFHYYPTQEREVFVANHPYQTDYLKVKTGKIILNGYDPNYYLKDSIIKVDALIIDDVVLDDYRDRRPPFHSGIIKPLPTKLIQKIPFKLSIDTIRLNNATSIYSEFNDKTLAVGSVPVTKMTVRFFPVKNYDLTDADTLKIQANGYLMDSMWIRLRIRESYTDSLSGFLMTVRMRPHDLQILNPVFMPLSSIKIQSGYLDTLTMRAIGKDNFAYGEMKMHYHDLKIKFLNKGSEIKKGFLSGLKTFVANSFILRNKNYRRTGRVFFIRNREKSMLNYIIKIPMSGIASSVGAKSNRKILRKYKKELRLRNLPPYDYD